MRRHVSAKVLSGVLRRVTASNIAMQPTGMSESFIRELGAADIVLRRLMAGVRLPQIWLEVGTRIHVYRCRTIFSVTHNRG